MNDIDVIQYGKVYPASAVQMVDALLKKVQTKPTWEGIEFIVNIYLRKYPEYNKKVEQNLINEYASTKDKSMRKLLSMPPDLKSLIEYFYQDRITETGEIKFWREFAKRYPVFSQAVKI